MKTAPISAVDPIGNCHNSGASPSTDAAAGSSTTRGGSIESSAFAQHHDFGVEVLEIDVVGRQRFDNQALGTIEKWRRFGGRGDRVDLRRQLR